MSEGDADIEEGALKGQYYFYITYAKRPTYVLSTFISTSTVELRNRTAPSERKFLAPPERKDDSLLHLLSLYSRISGYSVIGFETIIDSYILPDVRFSRFLNKDSEDVLTNIRKRGKSDLFVSHSLDIKRLKTQLHKFRSATQYGYAVRNAVFVGLVATFDELIASLIRTAIRGQPRLLASFDRTISYQDVAAAKDFPRLQQDLITVTVYELMKKGRLEQIAWIEKYISGTKLKDQLQVYDRLIEITERRNAYVHNDGFPSEDYLSKVSLATGSSPESTPGERIHTSETYFREATDALIEAYVLLSQAVVRKLAKNVSEDDSQHIDHSFNNAIYFQIEEGRNESAVRLAEMMLSGKFKTSDLALKMAIINHAIALTKCGKQRDAENVLSKTDWSSARDEFALCVAALRQDMEKVKTYIPKLVGSDMLNPQSYFEWPAFDGIRDLPEFWTTLVEVYGDEIRRAGTESPTGVTDPGGKEKQRSEGKEGSGDGGPEPPRATQENSS